MPAPAALTGNPATLGAPPPVAAFEGTGETLRSVNASVRRRSDHDDGDDVTRARPGPSAGLALPLFEAESPQRPTVTAARHNRTSHAMTADAEAKLVACHRRREWQKPALWPHALPSSPPRTHKGDLSPKEACGAMRPGSNRAGDGLQERSKRGRGRKGPRPTTVFGFPWQEPVGIQF